MKYIPKMMLVFGVLAMPAITVAMEAEAIDIILRDKDSGLVVSLLVGRGTKGGELKGFLLEKLQLPRDTDVQLFINNEPFQDQVGLPPSVLRNVREVDYVDYVVRTRPSERQEQVTMGKEQQFPPGTEETIEQLHRAPAKRVVPVQFKDESGNIVQLDVKEGEPVASVKERLKKEGMRAGRLGLGGYELEETLPSVLRRFMIIDVEPVRTREQLVVSPLTLQQRQPGGKSFPYKKVAAGVGVSAVVTAAAIGAAYAGLKWYQKKRIRRVIAKHDLKLTDFSQTQKDAMAVAVLASRKVPGSMLRLGKIVRRGKLGSATISTEQMWTILADLYYRKTATTRDVQILQKRLAQ